MQHLTTRQICERYARLCNREAGQLGAFVALLHPDVKWITKWKNYFGKQQIEPILRQNPPHDKRTSEGLSFIALVSGHCIDNGVHADCVVSVPIHEPDRYDTRTYFKTDGQRITEIFTYAVWMHRTWPYPERLKNKLAELICKDILISPIQPGPKPPRLIWPDDGRNREDAEARRRQADLQTLRESMATALAADPQGAGIPDIELE